jgi:D-tyrosyl-tRNA(Tyr) deacylase
MRAVIQRVSRASVAVEGYPGLEPGSAPALEAGPTPGSTPGPTPALRSSIGGGLLVFLGIEDADTSEDIEWLSGKIVNLRVFNDADGVMNISVKDRGGDIMLVSQFTLHASTKKGNRPSYVRASKGPVAVPLYEEMIRSLENGLGKPIGTGVFGADMKVELLNDGPVTIVIDTKNRE